jgi:hypothetical protein
LIGFGFLPWFLLSLVCRHSITLTLVGSPSKAQHYSLPLNFQFHHQISSFNREMLVASSLNPVGLLLEFLVQEHDFEGRVGVV